MKRTVLIITLLLFWSILYPQDASASLLTIKEDGEVIWNVLSEEDSIGLEVPRHPFIEVRRVLEATDQKTSQVTLTKKNDKVSLIVTSGNQIRELDITQVSQDLVEIEERAETQKVTIGVIDDKFSLFHKGITAVTEFPVAVDSLTAQVSVETSTGKRFLSVFPYDAIEAVLRAKLINRIADKKVEIIEKDWKLQYRVEGEKVFNLFNVYQHQIPISYYISASTGEILSIDAPNWLKALGFLFS